MYSSPNSSTTRFPTLRTAAIVLPTTRRRNSPSGGEITIDCSRDFGRFTKRISCMPLAVTKHERLILSLLALLMVLGAIVLLAG